MRLCGARGPGRMRCQHPNWEHRGWHYYVPVVAGKRGLMQTWSADPCEAVSEYGDRCRHSYGAGHAGPHQAPCRGLWARLQRLVYEWHDDARPDVEVWLTTNGNLI